MLHYLFELAVFMLVVFFLGCAFGWFLKNVFGTSPQAAVVAAPVVSAAAVAAPVVVRPAPMPTPPAPPAPRVEPVPVSVTPVARAPHPAPVPVAGPGAKMERPKGLPSARGGKADNLQRISGVGPKNESILHNLGVFHFDQIAAWTTKEIVWVDDHLRFNGRIIREEWVRQANLLADGKEDEFTKEFGTGGLKGKDGQTHSGSFTRKR